MLLVSLADVFVMQICISRVWSVPTSFERLWYCFKTLSRLSLKLAMPAEGFVVSK